MREIEFTNIDHVNWFAITKLDDDIVSYLWDCIEDAKKENVDHRRHLAGNISRSLVMKDKKNLLLEKVYSGFYNSDLKDIFIDQIEKSLSHVFSKDLIFGKGVEPIIADLWVNFQKKHEFNTIHHHGGVFSFVIWMKIPYEWKDEAEVPWVKGSNVTQTVGNFLFVPPSLRPEIIFMGKSIESHFCIFPSHLHHMVNPFYTSDEERISISGNIYFELDS